MNKSFDAKSILCGILGDRPIAYYRCLAKISGSVAGGVFLSQALYWSNRTNDPDGWFYKTQTDWYEETMLSRREQERARKALKELNILEEQRRGVPAQLYFRINPDALMRSLTGEPADESPGTDKLDCTDRTNWNGASVQTGMAHPYKLDCTDRTNYLYTETTPETTPETSTEITSSSILEATTAENFEGRGSKPQIPSPVQPHPTPSKPENIPAETHGTKPKLPPRHPGLAPNPDSYTPPVPLTPPSNWRKPWEADAPWESPEERQAFEAFIIRTLKEKGKYSSDLLGFIMSRTAKGEDMGTWIAYRASTGGTEASQPAIGVPEEWTRLLDECVALSFAPNPLIARLEGLNMFRVKYTYSSTGQETKLGPDADKWAIAEKKRLEQELQEKRGAS